MSKPMPKASDAKLNTVATDFLAARGISQSTAESAEIYACKRFIHKVGAETDCIAFPYIRDGGVVNTKYRSITQKGFSQEVSGDQIFYLLDKVTMGEGAWVIIASSPPSSSSP